MASLRWMLAVFALSSFAGGYHCNSVQIGPEKCAIGPKYFCETIKNAVECNAVTHCIQTEWETTRLTNNEDSCKICEEVIGSIRKGMSANFSQESVKETLEHICDLTFVTQLLRRQCTKIVDEYIGDYMVDIMKLIASKADPIVVCKKIKLCLDNTLVVSDERVKIIFPENFLGNSDSAAFEPVLKPKRNNQLVGASECTWGPSFWCQNITTSAKCKTTHHCIERVWSKQNFADDNDDVCKICKDMVQQARDTLRSNETQEELKQVLEGSCNLIPLKKISEECDKLADEFVPELTEILASEMNPVAVCTTAGLCNSVRIDKLLHPHADEQEEGLKLCNTCNKGIELVQKYIQTSSEENVLSRILDICGEFSSFSDLCSSSVLSHWSDLYAALKGGIEPFQVCYLNGMCAYKYHFHPEDDDPTLTKELSVDMTKTDVSCDFCTQIVDHFRDVLISNTTEDEFHTVLLEVCKQTGSFKDKCKEIVDANFAIFYNYVVNEVNGSVLCTDIGICPKKGIVLTDRPLDLINRNLIPSDQQQLMMDVLKPRSDLYPGKWVEGQGPICSLCQDVLHFIQTELDNQTTEIQIENTVKKICNVVPSTIKNECVNFITQYGDLIITMLAEEIDPTIVCPLLKLCSSSRSSDPNCGFCLLAIQDLENSLQTNKTKETIEHYLDRLCLNLPNNLLSECITFVNKNYEELVELLLADLTPLEVCAFLRSCNVKQNVLLPEYYNNNKEDQSLSQFKVDESKPSPKECSICELVIFNIEKDLSSNVTEEVVDKAIDKFCSRLNKILRSECEKFAKKYVKEVVDYIQKGVKPSDVCTKMDLCPAKEESNEINDEECKTCEAAFGSLEGLLGDPFVDSKIAVTGERVCKFLPPKYLKTCLTVMDQITGNVLNVALEIPAWFACSKLRFCPYLENDNKNLSEELAQCIKGPSYWCESMKVAAKCNAVKYCARYVWGVENALPVRGINLPF